jgi:hypothetical protein
VTTQYQFSHVNLNLACIIFKKALAQGSFDVLQHFNQAHNLICPDTLLSLSEGFQVFGFVLERHIFSILGGGPIAGAILVVWRNH